MHESDELAAVLQLHAPVGGHDTRHVTRPRTPGPSGTLGQVISSPAHGAGAMALARCRTDKERPARRGDSRLTKVPGRRALTGRQYAELRPQIVVLPVAHVVVPVSHTV